MSITIFSNFVLAEIWPVASSYSWLATVVFDLAATVWLAHAVMMQTRASENSKANLLAARLASAVVFCGTLALSSRPFCSALLVLFLLRGLTSLSEVKFKYLRTYLHAYDFIYYPRQAIALKFLMKNLSGLVAFAVGITLTHAALLALSFSIEPMVIPRPYAVAAFAIALVTFLYVRQTIVRHHANHFSDPSTIAHFIDTIDEAWEALQRGNLLAAESATDSALQQPYFLSPKLEKSPPHIIVIVNESTFPPYIYPSIKYEPSLIDFFRSVDGKLRGLRVEAYGGASWITEFSLLTGIPANSYGSLRHYVFNWAAGKIKHSLPFCLRRFGYRTTAFYPSEAGFLGADKFFESIGFDEMLDKSALKGCRTREPDSYFYGRALETLAEQLGRSAQPTFTYIFTISNHDPHTARYHKDGSTLIHFGTAPQAEIAEYVRRLQQSAADYVQFRADLKQRFPNERFFIVHLGDHQPPLTWRLLGNAATWAGSDQLDPNEELAFRTYYAIDGVNFVPEVPDNLPAIIEISYLGTLIIRAAGLPLDAVGVARWDLMMKHKGKLFFADQTGSIARQLNGRLISAGLLTPH